jgi:hypothetical protein
VVPPVTTLTLSSETKASLFGIMLWRCWASSEHGIARLGTYNLQVRGYVTCPVRQAINKALLRSGTTIDEMNCLRKHLSAIKGERLAAAAAPARVGALLISDVPGDDPSVIASGPTVADPTTVDDARAVLAKYRVDAPPAIWDAISETVKPDDPRLARVDTILVATRRSNMPPPWRGQRVSHR